MHKSHFDIAILGGGCAALNFAMLFQKSAINKTVVIIEAKNEYKHDRNWSFWIEKGDRFFHSDIIKKTWPSWAFSSLAFKETHSSNNYNYATVASEDFYKKALVAINQDDRQTLALGEAVKVCEWSKGQNIFEIKTDQHKFSANHIIDTRPVQNSNIAELSSYFQIFFGYEIETERDFFDDQTAGLMEDLKPFDTGVSFIYTLPFSKRKALVEYTVFTSDYVCPNTLEDQLKQHVLNTIGENGYKIVATEKAVLPMGRVRASKPQTHNYISAGGQSGGLRESSGYGFLRLHQWAQSTIRALQNQDKVVKVNQDTIFTKLMDRHFIKTLKQNPQHSAQIFMAMAKNTKSDRFARFMNGDAKFIDWAMIVLAVPKAPFIKALFVR